MPAMVRSAAGSASSIRLRPDWRVAGWCVVALSLLPVAALLILAGRAGSDIGSAVLGRYLLTSLMLMSGAGALALVLGTATAWATATIAFPMRRAAGLFLLFPLALPTYAAAYALADFTDYAGPVQTGLRAYFGWRNAGDYPFPDFRSLPGAILVFGFAFYPYVYLLARAAFEDRSVHAEGAARSLGLSPSAVLVRLDLPLARPAIIAGLAIVLMETLADFGAVEHFGVRTLTTGVFSVWTSGNNPGGAARIAAVILLIVAGLILAERRARAGRRFNTLARPVTPPRRREVRRGTGLAILALCLLPPALGFALPAGVLAAHALEQGFSGAGLWRAAGNSLLLGVLVAVAAIAASLALALALREGRGLLHRIAPLAALGYAAPGAVLALGVLVPLAAFDHRLADFAGRVTGRDPGLILTGTLAALVLAFTIRFFALAQGAVDSAFARITPRMDMAARCLGASPAELLIRVHWPVIRGTALAGGILVFLDSVKELPATLMLRPFGFETLATFAYYRASAEDIAGAAPAVLLIAAVGLVPVLLLAGAGKREGRR